MSAGFSATSSMSGTTAVVTGGASGIGKATALAFASAGANVVIGDVDHTGGPQVAAQISESDGSATFVHADVSKESDVEALISTAIDTYGQLDFALNNAGVVHAGKSIIDYSEEEWDLLMGINLKGVWLCMKHELPRMIEQGNGVIVNTSSMAGLVGLRGSHAYAASKHGIMGLTRSAALSYAGQGIRINAICPGYARSEGLEKGLREFPGLEDSMVSRTPLGRLATTEEIAAAVIWLCSEQASFMTGHGLVMDGGAIAGIH